MRLAGSHGLATLADQLTPNGISITFIKLNHKQFKIDKSFAESLP